MKPHLILKLRRPLDRPVQYWEEIITDKTDVPTSISGAVDQLIQQTYRLPYWVSSNFKPRGATWSADERQQGFDRVYRLILQRNAAIPPALVKSPPTKTPPAPSTANAATNGAGPSTPPPTSYHRTPSQRATPRAGQMPARVKLPPA